jgi:hypothetical protein
MPIDGRVVDDVRQVFAHHHKHLLLLLLLL